MGRLPHAVLEAKCGVALRREAKFAAQTCFAVAVRAQPIVAGKYLFLKALHNYFYKNGPKGHACEAATAALALTRGAEK